MKILDWALDRAFLNFDEERHRRELKILELSRRQVALILLFFGTVSVALCCLGTLMGFNFANTRCMVYYQNMRIIENYNYTCMQGAFSLRDTFMLNATPFGLTDVNKITENNTFINTSSK